MLNSIKRRLTRVEESLPLPMTAERFYAQARRHANRKGGTVGDAMDKLLKDLSDGDLESLSSEFEQIAFGSDTAARDAAKREVLIAAGYPVWNLPGAESEEGAW